MVMEPVLSYQFQSEAAALFIFWGVTAVGAGLGCVFWLDFRRRSSRAWRMASVSVLLCGVLLGGFFGYLAAQPEYFKRLSADSEGVRLEYYLLREDAFLHWADIQSVSLRANRLVIVGRKPVATYRSPVVYRGDQERLLRSLEHMMPQIER
jgi:hypothetical protein